MANLRTPCTICHSKGRHRKLPSGEPCPNKNKGRAGRKENPEDAMRRLREEACALPDGAFAAHARAIATEAKARAKKIREKAAAEAARVQAEAEAQLRDLSSLTGGEDEEEPEPAPAPAPPAERAEPTTTVAAARPAMIAAKDEGLPAGVLREPTGGLTGALGVCGALCPDNVLVKCKQATRGGKHNGDHYNPQMKKAWPQQVRRAS